MVEEKHADGSDHELLTAEQQAMWRRRHRDEIKSLSPEAKKEFNKQQRHELGMLGAEDLEKTRTELQAEWDALPADKKEKIGVRIAERDAR